MVEEFCACKLERNIREKKTTSFLTKKYEVYSVTGLARRIGPRLFLHYVATRATNIDKVQELKGNTTLKQYWDAKKYFHSLSMYREHLLHWKVLTTFVVKERRELQYERPSM